MEYNNRALNSNKKNKPESVNKGESPKFLNNFNHTNQQKQVFNVTNRRDRDTYSKNTNTETFGNREYQLAEMQARNTETFDRASNLERRNTSSTQDGNLIVGNRVKKHKSDYIDSTNSVSGSPMRNNLQNRLNNRTSNIESTGKVNRRLGFKNQNKMTGTLTEPQFSERKKKSESSLGVGTVRGTHDNKMQIIEAHGVQRPI